MINQTNDDLLVRRMMAISELQAHPRNYREHPDDQLEHIVQSIKDHGFYRNVVIANDNTILAGHGVVQAAIKMGLQEVPVICLGKNHVDVMGLKLLLADNEIAKLGIEDDRLKVILLQEIKLREDLNGTGFDDLQLEAMDKLTRPPDAMLQGNEREEWDRLGMPDYEPGLSSMRLVIQFRTEKDRQKFVKKFSIKVSKKGAGAWSAWWPPQGEDGQVMKWAEK